MTTKKVQLYLDRDKTIEASPETSANCVILSDGNDLQKVLDNDLTNPTVVHEETSFKVGVGDIDVSSSVVDGEVGRMVIKGKTYQNILPEPSTHVLTNNKEMFKVNEGLDTNVEIVDGVSKSAILSGQTLVNLATENSIQFTTTGDWKHLKTKQKMLNTTKNYMVKFNSSHDYTGYVHLRDRATNTYITGAHRKNFKKGSNVVLLDSFLESDLESFSDIVITFFSDGDSATNLTITDVMLIEYQEDMENWDIPYFEGMQSVKLPVLKTTGKNLFDKEAFYNDWKSKVESYVYKEIVDNEEVLKVNNFYHLFADDKGFRINVEKGVPLTFRMKCKKAGTESTNAVFTIRYGDNIYKSFPICHSDEWTTHTTTFVPTRDYITICSGYNNGGYYYVKNIQLEEGSVATSYEPFKSNILTVNEDVELRGIGDVKDTLDCLTGEVTERIEEVVLDGSDGVEYLHETTDANTLRFFIKCFGYDTNVNTRVPFLSNSNIPNKFAHSTDEEGIFSSWGGLYIRISKTKLTENNIVGFKAYLSQNPITVQYQLATESIKTVDLSSSGNWEKVVLDGSENWERHGNYGSVTRFNVTISNMATGQYHVFSDKFPTGAISTNDLECVNNHYSANQFQLQIKTSRLASDSVDGLKQYLQQNPITVWYQTQNHLDSTQVKQPIFFKDGHIQLSSGVDNSLIPTLDYQAKTSNSYVMDLMKTNTKYTMKAKSASGTFTIDGTSYGAGTNGTFTTPSSMTNKFLVMSNKTNEEVMILEGDVVSKAIPYFKGIKSAFEDESKIEVLSTNCVNLFNPKDIVNDTYWDLNVVGKTSLFISSPRRNAVNMQQIDINGAVLTSRVNELEDLLILHPNAVKLRLQGGCFRPTDTWHELIVPNLVVADAKSENNVKEIDYATNSTKIPLLSPLRSLPNGVCDELTIDRMKKKATLIQRIKTVTFDGSSDERWRGYNDGGTRVTQGFYHDVLDSVIASANVNLYCDTLQPNINAIHHRNDRGVGTHNNGSNNRNIRLCLLKNELIPYGFSEPLKSNENVLRKWLQDNPTTVCYELATPVVTEIDLENFPLVYKDGHIFLNSEIAPVVEIDYNVNQAQQIQANNETLQRHELDILDLDNLIVSFVNAEYKLRLLKFNMELSMMASVE